MRRTTIITTSLVCILAGLGLARLKYDVQPQLLLGGLTIPLFYKISRKVFIVNVLVFCVFLGLVRGQAYMNQLQKYEPLFKQQATILVTANADANYSERKQLAFTAVNIQVLEPKRIELVGELNVEGFGTPAVFRGDRVRIEGKIYPTLGGKQGSIRFANMTIVGRQENAIDKLRHRFSAGIFNALPEPAASFALGLLVGQRSTLESYVADALVLTGLTHIVAVSGYNLTIIVRAVQNLRAKKSRYQAALLSLSLVVVFVLLVGNSPSITRAAIVSLLSILCWYYGRNIKPVLLILLVAALTALYKPTYVWSDIGWYLSFLAFFGVLVLAPLIVKKFSKNKEPKIIKLIVIETICAQILTAPLILYIFGRTSILGIVANVMVVPLVPLAMLLSLFAGIAGMLLPNIAGFIGLPAKYVLNYMLGVTTLFSKFPYISFERTITLIQMLLMYASIGLTTIILWRKKRKTKMV